MADRAAPTRADRRVSMSSEEEARDRVCVAIMEVCSPYVGAGGVFSIDAEPIEVALDAYRTAIEQRVLAQQPCYRQIQDPFWANCISAGVVPCGPCTARQTQETSG